MEQDSEASVEQSDVVIDSRDIYGQLYEIKGCLESLLRKNANQVFLLQVVILLLGLILASLIGIGLKL